MSLVVSASTISSMGWVSSGFGVIRASVEAVGAECLRVVPWFGSFVEDSEAESECAASVSHAAPLRSRSVGGDSSRMIWTLRPGSENISGSSPSPWRGGSGPLGDAVGALR